MNGDVVCGAFPHTTKSLTPAGALQFNSVLTQSTRDSIRSPRSGAQAYKTDPPLPPTSNASWKPRMLPVLLTNWQWISSFVSRTLIFFLESTYLPVHPGPKNAEAGICSIERKNSLILNWANLDTESLCFRNPTSWWCIGCRLYRAKSQDIVGEGFGFVLGVDVSEVR